MWKRHAEFSRLPMLGAFTALELLSLLVGYYRVRNAEATLVADEQLRPSWPKTGATETVKIFAIVFTCFLACNFMR